MTVIFGDHWLIPPSAVQVQNDQCQSTDSASRWMKISETKWSKYLVCLNLALLPRFQVIDSGLQIPTIPVHCAQAELKTGNNVLYWRTTGYVVAGSEVKPVLLRNIGISGKLSAVSNRPHFKGVTLPHLTSC